MAFDPGNPKHLQTRLQGPPSNVGVKFTPPGPRPDLEKASNLVLKLEGELKQSDRAIHHCMGRINQLRGEARIAMRNALDTNSPKQKEQASKSAQQFMGAAKYIEDSELSAHKKTHEALQEKYKKAVERLNALQRTDPGPEAA